MSCYFRIYLNVFIRTKAYFTIEDPDLSLWFNEPEVDEESSRPHF